MKNYQKTQILLTPEQLKEIEDQYSLLNIAALEEREKIESDVTIRNNFERDYTRVLYSSSFRRLAGKMQILGVKSSAFYRNRLTHSLEVEQIASSIAKKISSACFRLSKSVSPSVRRNLYGYRHDLMVINAAALAHDIGHPAFGHKGERVLDDIGKHYGLRFEGNAQNFRILRKLEKKSPYYKGLNLTPRTLLAINKYMVSEDASPDVKKFIYRDDYDYLEKIRKKTGIEKRRTLDVQIIELADDIAYAVHDLEDGLKLRKFSIEDIIFLLKKKISDKKDKILEAKEMDFEKLQEVTEEEKALKVFLNIVDDGINTNCKIVDNVDENFKYFTNYLTSSLTHWFINNLDLRMPSKDDLKKTGSDHYKELTLTVGIKSLLEDLKDTVFECSTRDDEIHLYETRGEIVIKNLFLLYTDLSTNEDGKLFPPIFRPKNSYKKIKNNYFELKDYNKTIIQNSIDYLAGMMDAYAIEQYERFFNKKFGEIDITSIAHINAKLLERAEQLNDPMIKI